MFSRKILLVAVIASIVLGHIPPPVRTSSMVRASAPLTTISESSSYNSDRFGLGLYRYDICSDSNRFIPSTSPGKAVIWVSVGLAAK